MSTRIGIEGLQGIPTVAGLHGVLRGILDAELRVWDPIPGAEIVAVPVREPAPPAGPTSGASRRTVVQVPHERVAKETSAPGALRGKTDDRGQFAIANREFAGGFWRIYACFDAIHSPGSAPAAPLRREVCFDLGVYAGERPVAADIPEALYCALKRLADRWTVFGRVTECSSGQSISGAVVSASDTDWIQDDALGTATSNASGVYRIDYPGSAFRRGTFIDVELFGGPDIYFKVTDSASNVLIDEAPGAGRAPGRGDRGCCARIDLCSRVGVHPGGGVYTDAWVSVGSQFVIPDASSLNDFDAAGYMGAAKYALAEVSMMHGDVERETSAGRPVEYRFLVSHSPTPNGGPPPADGTFTRIVGAGGPGDVALFADGAIIGEMVRLSPLRIVKIDARATDLRPGGWLRVDDCIERVFSTTPGLSLADIPAFIWNPAALLGLNTRALTTAPDVPAGAAAAGSPVPAADHIPVETFALRFQIRSVDPGNPADVTPLPGDGITLNSLVVNNNAVFLALGVDADGTHVLCDPAHGNISLPYTAYHPELQTVSIGLHPNGGADVFDATPLSGNTNPAVTESVNAGLFVGTLTRCGYIVTLGATPRRHTGDIQVGYTQVQATFFYE